MEIEVVLAPGAKGLIWGQTLTACPRGLGGPVLWPEGPWCPELLLFFLLCSLETLYQYSYPDFMQTEDRNYISREYTYAEVGQVIMANFLFTNYFFAFL